MTSPPEQRPPIAVAMEWVSRILAIALVMVIPGIAGKWLDDRWGTSVLAPLGFVLGMVVAIWYLLQITRSPRRKDPKAKSDGRSPDAHDDRFR